MTGRSSRTWQLADAVVTTAGNQLVGEVLYLEKPVLAMPESNNFEQFINAFFLEQSGTGSGIELEKGHGVGYYEILDRADEFRRGSTPRSSTEIQRPLKSSDGISMALSRRV